MKKLLPLLPVFLLCSVPLAAQRPETPNGQPPPAASSSISPPADIAEMIRLEDERAGIRRALAADLKAAEKQAAEAAKSRGKEAAATIRAASLQKQKDQAVRLREIAARLEALRPEAKATQPAKVR